VRTGQGLATETLPKTPGRAHPKTQGQAYLPPHRRGAWALMCSWLKRTRSELSSQKSTLRCEYCVPPLPEKPRRAVDSEILST
jgi:hypothetical protein